MKVYHTPDSRWELWSAKTIEEHIEKNVIKGKFHAAVPTTIIEAYKTAEYMMVYAFYHWQMYDEAVKKIAVIAEMAIKQKAIQLNIKLKVVNKNGVAVDQKLNALIDQVLKGKDSESLKNDFHLIKNFRNAFIHQEQNSFAGGSLKSHITPMLNRINELFLDKFPLALDHVILKIELKKFQNKCLILEINQLKFLAFMPQLYSSLYNQVNLYCFSYEIILNLNTEEEIPSQTHILKLKQLKISADLIEGITLGDESFKIFPTEKIENTEKFNKVNEIIHSNEEMKIVYGSVKPISINQAAEDFRYQFAWEC